MTVNQSTLAELAIQVVRGIAARRRLTEDETCDAISIAWEFAQSGRGFPKSIAWYAVMRIRSARRFRGESIRSLDSPKHKPGNPERSSSINLADLASPGCNPATVACLKIDFEQWMSTLPERLRSIAESLANGESTSEVAERLEMSAGRISQIRRQLEKHWREFQGACWEPIQG